MASCDMSSWTKATPLLGTVLVTEEKRDGDVERGVEGKGETHVAQLLCNLSETDGLGVRDLCPELTSQTALNFCSDSLIIFPDSYPAADHHCCPFL